MERLLWDRIQEIYYSTLPLDKSARSEFIATACSHDMVLAREVNSLLEADESSNGFLESPIFEIGLRIISSHDSKKAKPSTFLDNLVGTTIHDRYLVEKKLGHGGIGKVYLARDLQLHNRPVVIKLLLEASLQDTYAVKKFHQEVEALARLDHPNVVNVLGAGKFDDGKPFIVMQCVNGVTLRSQIPSEGMSFERTASILQQIGAALDDVHEKGIFHRDLKPENIMLQVKSGSELVKIVDFGIAKVKDSVVAPSTVNEVPVGTLLYMSPEQLRGGTKLTPASDIYSMAVVAYEMITGRRPFNPASGPQLLEMHRDGLRVKPIDLRTSLPTEAQAILLRALSFEPSARYQSASEFGDTLARALVTTEETENRNKTWQSFADSQQPKFDQRAVTQSSAKQATDSGNGPVVSGGRLRKFLRSRTALVSGLLLVLICAGALYKIITGIDNAKNVIPGRGFTYWLTVQKMRDDKPYQDPFQSSGHEIFESGYKFRLNVNSPDPGFLYVFNEGPPTNDGTSFTLVYPTPQTNNGSAAVGANQSVETNWNTFAGEPGTENFWIVWAESPIQELESVKTLASTRPNGALGEREIATVREYLKAKQAEVKLRTTRDRVSRMTTVRGQGKVLVRLVELEHR